MSKRNRRRNRQLRGATCSNMGKLPRGVIGAVVGGVLGAGAVATVFALMIPGAAQQADATGTVSPSMMALPMLLPVVGVVGSVAGGYIASRKPAC